ncbi:acetyl-CoA carboxylase biotin carboxyl carrier protein [Actinomadura luteofluorescens]|uniref:acetyl-CoA carboxylase biotin carboxyl carrier protein n=1 Tax=Actinomadura luteofluorescens TaxID=46163 RepID=UPI003471116A
MSTDTAAAPGPLDRVPAREQTDISRLCEQVVELLARLERPPRTLRVTAGEATLDIDWTEAAPAGPTASGAAPAPAAPATAGDAATADDTVYLTSPAVGVFYHAPEPGAEPFVSVGGLVQPGDQIGIVEAMKLMMPVEAKRAGRIAAVVKGDGEPVEFDEPLFALAPEEV